MPNEDAHVAEAAKAANQPIRENRRLSADALALDLARDPRRASAALVAAAANKLFNYNI